jgi:hypothetical protein
MSRALVLVVADHEDHGARRAARAAASSLEGRDGAAVWVVTGAELAAARWCHAVSVDGRATTRVQIPGRTEIYDDEVAGVLFRSLTPPVPPGLRHATEPDRSYAASEMTALLTSWLASLGDRVMNAVEGAGPTGPTWTPQRWLQLATEAGFECGSGPTVRSVLVAGGRVAGALDPDERARALRLADLTGCHLVEVGLTDDAAAATVSCVPLLLDPAHVTVLAEALLDLLCGEPEVSA